LRRLETQVRPAGIIDSLQKRRVARLLSIDWAREGRPFAAAPVFSPGRTEAPQAEFGGRPDRELLLRTKKKNYGRSNLLPNQLLSIMHSKQDRSALSLCRSARRLQPNVFKGVYVAARFMLDSSRPNSSVSAIGVTHLNEEETT